MKGANYDYLIININYIRINDTSCTWGNISNIFNTNNIDSFRRKITN